MKQDLLVGVRLAALLFSGVLGGMAVGLREAIASPSLSFDFSPSPAVHGKNIPKRQFITLTGSKQGSYYKAAIELNELLKRSGLHLRVKESAGSLQNLQAIAEGKADLAFIQMDVAALQEESDRANGTNVIGKIRIFAPVTNEVIHIITNKRSGIQSLKDLQGKRVSFGPQESGTAVSAKAIYSVMGLKAELASQNIQFMDVRESIQKVNRGELDAAFFTASKGVPLLLELSPEDSNNLQLLSLSNDEFVPLEQTQAGFSLYAPVYIAAKTYPWQQEETSAISVFAFLVVRSNLEPQMVYELAKLIYPKAADLRQQDPFWKFLSIEQAKIDISGKAPYHLGVIKFIHEMPSGN
ncbi:TAXI family TRAP transporter solute-binding subunit [Tumidithrix helvetica PCC 7403]|uniref:TAXI family TRAP transporter solute-binding subunit n=1 Tax=Tumidithrix helvetica TaxID=3457545 RepID=UPI003C9C36F7